MVDNKFELGQVVYLITDTEQKPRLISSIHVHPEIDHQNYNRITYGTMQADVYYCASEFEITAERNLLIVNNEC